MTASNRSPAHARLDVLVGRWSIQPTPPPEWNITDPDLMTGSVTYEWALAGAYLIGHCDAPDPIPDSVTIIAPDAAGYLQHYHDSRGVSRLHRMTLADRRWTLTRTEADFTPLDFAQRFVGEFGPDDSTIDGRWEQSRDRGRTWTLDFAITYRR